MASESRTVMGAGDSAVMFSETVMEVWTGSGVAAGGVWPGAGSGEATRMQNTSGAPSQLVEAARLHGEDDGDGRLKVVLQRDGPASRRD